MLFHSVYRAVKRLGHALRLVVSDALVRASTSQAAIRTRAQQLDQWCHKKELSAAVKVRVNGSTLTGTSAAGSGHREATRARPHTFGAV